MSPNNTTVDPSTPGALGTPPVPPTQEPAPAPVSDPNTPPAADPAASPETPGTPGSSETPPASATPPSTPPSTPPESTEEPGSEPKGPEKRIRQLTAQRREEERLRIKAEQEAAYYKGLAEGRITPGDQALNPKPTDLNTPPKVEDFDDYEEYLVAKVQHTNRVAAERDRIEAENKKQRDAVVAAHNKFLQKVDEASVEHPEIMEVLADPTFIPNNHPMSMIIASTIKESDVSPQIVLYYNKNRAELDRLYSLSPYAAAKEIGRVEAALSATPPPPQPPTPIPPKVEPPKHITQAPPPIEPLAPSGPVEKDILDPDLPIKEFMARRNAQSAKRR